MAGSSLGAAIGIWLAGNYPERVKTLSLHSAWPKSDALLRTVVEGWRAVASGLGSVPEMIITGIFPWCFTPDFYSNNPESAESDSTANCGASVVVIHFARLNQQVDAEALNTQVGPLPGVITLDIGADTATIQYDPRNAACDALAETVRDLGFRVRSYECSHSAQKGVRPLHPSRIAKSSQFRRPLRTGCWRQEPLTAGCTLS